jgi:hypothetical protein
VGKARRQRRPTGAPPPLPHPITISTTAWLVLGAVVLAGAFLASRLSRPPPYGVPIIASWGGYSGVSPPVAVITIFLMGAVYCLAVPGCDTSGARQIPPDRPGTSRFERPLSLAPGFSGLRSYTFPGGCVTYEFASGQEPLRY